MPGPWDNYSPAAAKDAPSANPGKIDLKISPQDAIEDLVNPIGAVADQLVGRPLGKTPYVQETVGGTMRAAGGQVQQDAREDIAYAKEHYGQKGHVPPPQDAYLHPTQAGGALRTPKEVLDVFNAAVSPVSGALDALFMRPWGEFEHAVTGGAIPVEEGEASAGTALAMAGPGKETVFNPGRLARLKSAVTEAKSRIATGLGHEPGAAPTPAMRARAEPIAKQYVRQIVARADPTGTKLTAHPMEARGAPITAAEALGRPAETQLKVAGRRAGQTSDALEAQLRARHAETATRVVEDFGEITGLDPAAIEGDFTQKAKVARAKAKPLYEKLDEVGPVDSPALQTLLKRPSIQRALPYAYDIAREEDVNPHDIGISTKMVPATKDGQPLMRGGKPIMVPAGEIEVKTPKMRTWDYIKRGLDEVVEEYRDPTTGVLDTRKLGRHGVSGTREELRAELTNPETAWGPHYSAALEAGGEAPRMEEAYEAAPKLMSATVSEGDFSKRVSKFNPSQMEALKDGIVADARNKAMAGRQRLGEMVTDAYKLKLARVWGVEKADQIVQRVTDERFLMAHGQRMTPGIGSDTSESLLANREQERAIGDLANAARVAGKKAMGGNWAGAVLHLVGSTLEGAYRGAQTPIDEAVRDVVGALLMSSPSELARVLEGEGATEAEAEKVAGLFAKAGAYGPNGVAMLALQAARTVSPTAPNEKTQTDGPWSRYSKEQFDSVPSAASAEQPKADSPPSAAPRAPTSDPSSGAALPLHLSSLHIDPTNFAPIEVPGGSSVRVNAAIAPYV